MQTRPLGREQGVDRYAAVPGMALAVVERARMAWLRFKAVPVDAEPYEAGVTPLGRLLWKPAALGFVAVMMILIGASQPTSPFTLTKVPGSWFFGIPPRAVVSGVTPPPGQNLFVGIVLVYAGMVLLMRAWYDIYKVTARHPGIPVRKLAPVFALWVLPLLAVAPLFSRDVYSYAAQGEMMSHGINPYQYGPAVLGVNSWVSPVDTLWQNVTSPYGPLFLGAAGAIVQLTGHNELASVAAMRVLMLGGVVLIGVFLPKLARSYGYDGSTAFAFGVLNPLVILHLVGGAHNDALMLGLLVAGITIARQGRPVVGVILVTLAACVKVPAVIGVIYIGWEWLGDGATRVERIRPVVSAMVIAGIVMEIVTEVVGLGWGWIGALGNPDTVKSYLDPATALGLFTGHMLHSIGLPDKTRGILSLARGGLFLVAFVIGVYLLLKSNRQTSGRALGWTLLAVTVLGPVMQPWYLAWGVVFLAAVADTKIRGFLVALSCGASFLGLPGALTLLEELTVANPLLVIAASAALVGIAVVIVGPSIRRAFSGGDPEAAPALSGAPSAGS
jgi:alpha-1,6-mannosyltransferase